MKRWKLALPIILLLLFVVACEISFDTSQLFGGGSSSNVPFEVMIESPAPGSQFGIEPITINYKATSPEGVALVELNIDGNVVNLYTAPDPSQIALALQYSWTPHMGGSHIIKARAQDSQGNWTSYQDVMVTVIDESPQTAQQDSAPQQQEPEEPEATITPDTPYLYDVETDVKKFYYNQSTCGPRKITISLKASDPDTIWSVVVFTRFLDKEGEGQTKWDTGRAMSPKSDGTFSVTLTSNQITNYNVYEFAVFRYQFVATDENRNEVTRTEVFEDVSFEICN